MHNYDIKQLIIFTWNLGNSYDDTIKTTFANWMEKITDDRSVVVIGLQEVKLSPLELFLDTFIKNSSIIVLLETFLNEKQYFMVKAIQLLGMTILVAVHRSSITRLHSIDTSYIRLSLGGFLGFKGTTAIRLNINNLSFCFLNCHLNAGESYDDLRTSNYKYIEDKLYFNCVKKKINEHDVVILLGDLNYRLVGIEYNKLKHMLKNKNFKEITSFDQLSYLLKNDQIFNQFHEIPLTFRPTYKLNCYSSKYNTSRNPSYCDRILWKTNNTSSVDIIGHRYDCLDILSASDHLSVYAVLDLQISKYNTSNRLEILITKNQYIYPIDVKIEFCLNFIGFHSNSNDWIGLFEKEFYSLNKYKSFIWPSDNAEQFPISDYSSLYLNEQQYVLVYVSYIENWPVAISQPFELKGFN